MLPPKHSPFLEDVPWHLPSLFLKKCLKWNENKNWKVFWMVKRESSKVTLGGKKTSLKLIFFGSVHIWKIICLCVSMYVYGRHKFQLCSYPKQCILREFEEDFVLSRFEREMHVFMFILMGWTWWGLFHVEDIMKLSWMISCLTVCGCLEHSTT